MKHNTPQVPQGGGGRTAAATQAATAAQQQQRKPVQTTGTTGHMGGGKIRDHGWVRGVAQRAVIIHMSDGKKLVRAGGTKFKTITPKGFWPNFGGKNLLA